MTTTHDRLGGRTIELLIPFETMGRKIDAIHLKPVLFDHALRWQQGAFSSSLQLLAALSGEQETVLRLLRYPDADRVLAGMFEMLPDAIRSDISSGQIPQAAPSPESPPPEVDEPPPGPEEAFTGIDDVR